MNLLMRALDKATRDRNGGPASVSPRVGDRSELTLEPMLGRASAATEANDPDPGPHWDMPPAPADVKHRVGMSFPGPLTLFVAAAVLFGAGYGYYVYRQLNGLNAPAASPRAAPPPAAAPQPVSRDTPRQPATTAVEPISTAAVVERSPSPATPIRTNEPAGTPGAKPKADTASTPARSESPALSPSTSEPAAPLRTGESPAKPPAPPVSPPRQNITVSPGSNAAPRVDPVLSQAYSALQAGRYDEAQRLYAQVARSEPRSTDALLGLAAVAAHTGKVDEAVPLYMRILESDPRNSLAQASLLALVGQEDPLTAESRLKRLLEREPSAFLYFTLGNVYAGQRQWAQAQQAYFRAHHLDPANADYAYNLAVGLEHVGQHRIALGFYRRAVDLARETGRANFNTAQAEERINTLSAQPE